MGGAGGEQEPDADARRRGQARVLDQVEQVEEPVRRSLGQIPPQGRRGHAAFGVGAAARRLIPAHGPIDDDVGVRLDDRRDVGRSQPRQRLEVDGAARARRHDDDVRHGHAVLREEAEQHAGRHHAGVGQGDAGREERPGRALREIPRVEPAGMRPIQAFLGVGAAVAVPVLRGVAGIGRRQAELRLPVVGDAVAILIDAGAGGDGRLQASGTRRAPSPAAAPAR